MIDKLETSHFRHSQISDKFSWGDRQLVVVAVLSER